MADVQTKQMSSLLLLALIVLGSMLGTTIYFSGEQALKKYRMKQYVTNQQAAGATTAAASGKTFKSYAASQPAGSVVNQLQTAWTNTGNAGSPPLGWVPADQSITASLNGQAITI